MSTHQAIEKILQENPEIQMLYALRGPAALVGMSTYIYETDDYPRHKVEKLLAPAAICFALVDTKKNKIIASVEVNTNDENSILYCLNATRNSRRYRALSFLATEFSEYQRRAK